MSAKRVAKRNKEVSYLQKNYISDSDANRSKKAKCKNSPTKKENLSLKAAWKMMNLCLKEHGYEHDLDRHQIIYSHILIRTFS